MRLYRSQVPRFASAIIQTLCAEGDIEVEDHQVADAEQDLIAVMEHYLKTEHEIIEKAKDQAEYLGLSNSELGRIKRELSERYQVPLGDEGVRWILGQMIESLLASKNVSEVFSDDHVLRRKLMAIAKKYLVDESVLDREIRARLRHLEEGSSSWNIEYQKMRSEVRRKYGLA